MITTYDPALRATLEHLAPHDHLCSIYQSPSERFAVAVPFIKIGLERGEKCIYISDEDGTDPVLRDALQAQGVEVDRAIAAEKLVLETREHTYLKNGVFDPDWMFMFWENAIVEAENQGFPALRAAGETEWVIRGKTAFEPWLKYETRIRRLVEQHNCILLCQYNRELFPPDVVLDVIRTHPTVIYRGVLCRNMYYVPPEVLLDKDQPAREVERLLTNIHDREEIEAALRSSEERWRSVFENSAIGMAIGDAHANLLATNQAFQELVGYTGEELKSMTVYDLTHEDDIALNVQLRGELVAGTRREMQMEKQLRRKDGRLIWVRVTSSLIPATERTPAAVVALVEDITDRHLAEEELEASLDQSRALAGRVMHAQDEERRRIARMLHETTAQDLAGLKLHLSRLNRTAEHLSEAERQTLTESMALADQTIVQVRTLSYLLHPPFLDEAGLLSALRWYATGFTERSGIKVDLELPETFDRPPLDTETALFRIVQEALTNIHRHASSDTARIRLQQDAESLALEIEDRGHGIPAASLGHITRGEGSAGVGIAAMSERIEQLGGVLEITSGDRGTTVRVQLPLIQDGR